jgi:uncharacterized membrane protein (UPF0127 family)
MNFPIIGRWEDAESGDVLLEKLFVARTFWQRLRGLQFGRPLEPSCGLLLRDCRSVHTICMRFTIDLFFLSDDLTVVEVRRRVKPWQIALPKAKDVTHVIEVTSGNGHDISEGTMTRFVT